MSLEHFRLIAAISSLSILVPLLLGLIRWKRLNRLQRRIGILVIVTAVFEVIANPVSLPLWEWLTGEPRNLPGAHLYTLVQFSLVLWIYRELLERQTQTWVFPALLVMFLLFVLWNGLYLDRFRNFNPHARGIQAIILLPLILSYFYQLLRSMQIPRLEKEPLFWASSGFTIYFSGSLLIFLLSNYLLEAPETLRALYAVHSLLNILLNLLLAPALWIRHRKLT